jgi:hypothetical protein
MPLHIEHHGILIASESKRLPHSPCSPDLVPCDFWLFGTLRRKLEGSTFGNPVEVLTAVSTILNTIPLDKFMSVFDK